MMSDNKEKPKKEKEQDSAESSRKKSPMEDETVGRRVDGNWESRASYPKSGGRGKAESPSEDRRDDARVRSIGSVDVFGMARRIAEGCHRVHTHAFMTSSLAVCVSACAHSLAAEPPDPMDRSEDKDVTPLIELRPMARPEIKQMNYPDVAAILRFLPIEKRRELVKRAPKLRTLNKKLPYNFRKVELTLYHVKKTRWEVKCDNLLWKFEYFKDEERITIKMMNPEGKVIDLQQNGPVNRICQYFFDRPGNVIHTMNILNYNAAKFSNVHPLSVKCLKAKYTKNYYKEGLFKEFKNTKFQSIEVENATSRNNVMFEDLKHMNTDELRIWTNAAGEEAILELKPLQKFDCYEDASLDDDRFQKFCEKLKKESQLGSAYSCILYSRNFDPNGFLTEMQSEFCGEEKYLNGRKCISASTSKDDHEMNILCDNKVYFGELPRNKLVARIMKKGSAKTLHDTNRITRAGFDARSLLVRFLTFLLIAFKNHMTQHSAMVHGRFFIIPFVIYSAPRALSNFDVLILIVTTWFTWRLSMLFYASVVPHVTRCAFRIRNERVARGVWIVAVIPVFMVSVLLWFLSMCVTLFAYYFLYLVTITYVL